MFLKLFIMWFQLHAPKGYNEISVGKGLHSSLGAHSNTAILILKCPATLTPCCQLRLLSLSITTITRLLRLLFLCWYSISWQVHTITTNKYPEYFEFLRWFWHHSLWQRFVESGGSSSWYFLFNTLILGLLHQTGGWIYKWFQWGII